MARTEKKKKDLETLTLEAFIGEKANWFGNEMRKATIVEAMKIYYNGDYNYMQVLKHLDLKVRDYRKFKKEYLYYIRNHASLKKYL